MLVCAYICEWEHTFGGSACSSAPSPISTRAHFLQQANSFAERHTETLSHLELLKSRVAEMETGHAQEVEAVQTKLAEELEALRAVHSEALAEALRRGGTDAEEVSSLSERLAAADERRLQLEGDLATSRCTLPVWYARICSVLLR